MKKLSVVAGDGLDDGVIDAVGVGAGVHTLSVHTSFSVSELEASISTSSVLEESSQNLSYCLHNSVLLSSSCWQFITTCSPFVELVYTPLSEKLRPTTEDWAWQHRALLQCCSQVSSGVGTHRFLGLTR